MHRWSSANGDTQLGANGDTQLCSRPHASQGKRTPVWGPRVKAALSSCVFPQFTQIREVGCPRFPVFPFSAPSAPSKGWGSLFCPPVQNRLKIHVRLGKTAARGRLPVGGFESRLRFPLCKLIDKLDSDWQDDHSPPVPGGSGADRGGSGDTRLSKREQPPFHCGRGTDSQGGLKQDTPLFA